MKPILNTLLTATAVVALGPPVFGGILFSIDADPSTATIDSVRSVSPGQSITVSLVATLESVADSLSIYGVTVRFDNLELELDGSAVENNPSVVDAGNPLTPFTSGGLSQTDDRSPGGKSGFNDGQVGSFEASIIVGSGAVGPRSWVVGTIPFKVLTPLDDAAIDISPGLFTGLDGLYDNSTASVSATFAGAALVPEPEWTGIGLSAAALGLGLWLRRRRA